jgi:ASC-1-like (ASCH) protein
MSIISGDAYWAHVITPNTKFNPDGEWSIEVCNLDDTNKKIAKSDGLTIKNKGDERGDFVTLKQYARTKDGTFRPMSVKDAQRNLFPNDKRVGNGSKINASYYPKEYTQYGGGVKGYLQGVQIVNLVEYNTDDFEVVEGGYVNNENSIPFE